MRKGNEIELLVEGIESVSYTHLDVYKRQPFSCTSKCMP